MNAERPHNDPAQASEPAANDDASLADLPPRLLALRAAIQRGAYPVDIDALAEAMLDSATQLTQEGLHEGGGD